MAKAKRSKKKQISKPAKAVMIVLILLVLATSAVGLWWHWEDITGKNDEPGYIVEVDPEHIYF